MYGFHINVFFFSDSQWNEEASYTWFYDGVFFIFSILLTLFRLVVQKFRRGNIIDQWYYTPYKSVFFEIINC